MTVLMFSGEGDLPGMPQENGTARDDLYMQVCNAEVKVTDDGVAAIAWCRKHELALHDDAAFWVLLGQLEGSRRYAAIHKGEQSAADPLLFRPARQAGYRSLFQLSKSTPAEQRLAARAVHFGAWLHRSRMCGICGAQTRFATEQNKLVCSNHDCNSASYARVDPSIAALVVDGSRCLLARQPTFPKGFFAPLAGFIEPGETPEHTVGREVHEEVGLTVSHARYVTSQPWPFPASLMLGFIATVLPNQEMRLSEELEDAVWVERETLRDIVATPGTGRILPPPANLIGSALIRSWLAEHE